MLPPSHVFTNRYGTQLIVIRYINDFYGTYLKDNDVGDYDCFVLNRHDVLSQDTVLSIAKQLAQPRFEWIEVFGFNAELLHDMIDRAAVTIGRQSMIGNGNPMTAWNEERVELREILSYIVTGGQGACDWKVLLVIGTESQFQEVVSTLSTLVSTSSA
jgi:hypothetical protein